MFIQPRVAASSGGRPLHHGQNNGPAYLLATGLHSSCPLSVVWDAGGRTVREKGKNE